MYTIYLGLMIRVVLSIEPHGGSIPFFNLKMKAEADFEMSFTT
jgi:hypothetical protein